VANGLPIGTPGFGRGHPCHGSLRARQRRSSGPLAGGARKALIICLLLFVCPFVSVPLCSSCTWRYHPETREEYWLKNLRKVERLGYDLDRVLMVDDEAVKLERNYGNHIPIAPFTGASDDTELPLLARYLLSVSTRPNLRAIEKRHWRSDPGVANS